MTTGLYVDFGGRRLSRPGWLRIQSLANRGREPGILVSGLACRLTAANLGSYLHRSCKDQVYRIHYNRKVAIVNQ